MEEKATLKKVNIVISICSVIIILCFTAIGFIYVNNRSKDKFAYEDNLDKTVVTINDYSYDLREVSYYVIKMEAFVDNAANAYNENNPKAYWNLYINHTFVSKAAHDNCMKLVIRDFMYANEAAKLGLTLTDERLEEVEDEVHTILKNMSPEQMSITNYTDKELYDILYRVAMAEAYVTYLMDKDSSLTEEDLDTEGTYFEEMKENYDIDINDKIWDKIDLGRITINKD